MSVATDDLKVPSPEFFDDYETGGSFTPPPPAKFVNEKNKLQYKTYLATLPSSIEIGKTKDGYLKAVLKDIVLENGYVIGQTHVGSAQYTKKDKGGNVVGTRNSSPLGDLFRAAGVDLRAARPSTAAEYQQLLDSIAGRQIQVTIDWQAYDSERQQTVVEKYEDFPLENEANGPLSERKPVKEIGGKNFWARAQVKRWISAVEDSND